MCDLKAVTLEVRWIYFFTPSVGRVPSYIPKVRAYLIAEWAPLLAEAEPFIDSAVRQWATTRMRRLCAMRKGYGCQATSF